MRRGVAVNAEAFAGLGLAKQALATAGIKSCRPRVDAASHGMKRVEKQLEDFLEECGEEPTEDQKDFKMELQAKLERFQKNLEEAKEELKPYKQLQVEAAMYTKTAVELKGGQVSM